MTAVRRRAVPRRRQQGAVAVPVAVMLPVMLGVIGLATGLSTVYARSFEMQHLADATAVAAAHELDGTLAGISRVKSTATAVATGNYYRFEKPFSDGPSSKFDRRLPVTGDELVEYGYRCGISYNLLNANPSGPIPQKFLLDPIANDIAPSPDTDFSNAIMKPFFCNGSTGYGNLRANSTAHPSAFGTLFDGADWLNSRFGDSICTRNGAPPVENVTVFDTYNRMTTTRHSAKPALVRVGGTQVLETSADFTLGDLGFSVTANDFGPLWIYSNPVRQRLAAAVPDLVGLAAERQRLFVDPLPDAVCRAIARLHVSEAARA